MNFIVFSRLSLENYEKSCENRFRELQEMYCAREMDGLLMKDPYCLLYLCPSRRSQRCRSNIHLSSRLKFVVFAVHRNVDGWPRTFCRHKSSHDRRT